MLETVLWIYLGGFIALEIETFCETENSRVATTGEQIAMGTAANAIWPILAPISIYQKIKKD